MIQIRRQYQSLLFTRYAVTVLLTVTVFISDAAAQCMTAANPVGGSENLLVLERNTLRIISFYRHSYGDQFFEGSQRSDFDLISKANYNYAGAILGYGLFNKFTIETELGYYINKTYKYNLDTEYYLRGSGLSGGVLSIKYGLIRNNDNRFFLSTALGAKIPFSTKPVSRDGVELPVELQPTVGAYGAVFQIFMVKEQEYTGSRYFLTGRVDINSENKKDYRLGTSVFTSLFYSRHLMFSWLKGDWTLIMQLRNEYRQADRSSDSRIESTGSNILYLSPQINLFIREMINVSVMADIPVYRYFNGTQIGTKYGFSLNISREFNMMR